MSFNDLGLIEPLKKALAEEGYTQPTPIQLQAIPALLQQRDLLGCAQTGTGKTAAFALPILQLLHQRQPQAKTHRAIRALILTPTRELAIQIEESLRAYGRHLPLRHTVVFGGVGQQPQVAALQRGIDILVATPGRLLDLISQGFIDLRALEIFVLDEADRMLDMGFVHDVKRIIARLPATRHSLFFSATMPPDIADLARTILSNPVKVEVTPVSSTADTVQQQLYYVSKNDKRHLLLHLLQTEEQMKQVLVFTRTKHGADRVVRDLMKGKQSAAAIHGNKSQNARQLALQNFKKGAIRILVATDIAARGIDIDELGFVVNYELPNIPETYVHRIGRTGRAGNSGLAISFCDGEERAYLKDIQKLIGKQVPIVPTPAAIQAVAEEAGAQPAPARQHTQPRPQQPMHQRRNENRQQAHNNNRLQQGQRSGQNGQRRSQPQPAPQPTQQAEAKAQPTPRHAPQPQPAQPRRRQNNELTHPVAKPQKQAMQQDASVVKGPAILFGDEERW